MNNDRVNNVMRLQRGVVEVLANIGQAHDGIVCILDGDNKRLMLWQGKEGETEAETVKRCHAALEAVASPFNPENR